jgi:hypothetical protein
VCPASGIAHCDAASVLPVVAGCRKAVRVWRNWQTQHVGNVLGESP